MNSCCGKKCVAATIAMWLLVIGGLNWLLVGVSMYMGKGDDYNVVKYLLGTWSWLEALVYILVGLSAVMTLWGCKCATCATCEAPKA